jgi:hypothetical protein
MNTNQLDQAWKNLLAQSAPTFAAKSDVPYGFATATLAALRAERNGQREVERIGWRAIIASMGALSLAAALMVALDLREQGRDSDPNDRTVVQVENLPIS